MNEKFDKQKLLDLMGAEYDFVERTLMLVPENYIDHPDVVGYWSVKDTVAHLAAWQRRALRWLDEARQGIGVPGQHPVEPEPGFAWDAIDNLNAYSYEQDRDRPWDDVLAEFHRTFEELYEETEGLNEDELFGRSGLAAHFHDRLFGYIAHNSFLHYREHIEPVRAWLRQLSKFQTAENPAYYEE